MRGADPHPAVARDEPDRRALTQVMVPSPTRRSTLPRLSSDRSLWLPKPREILYAPDNERFFQHRCRNWLEPGWTGPPEGSDVQSCSGSVGYRPRERGKRYSPFLRNL